LGYPPIFSEESKLSLAALRSIQVRKLTR